MLHSGAAAFGPWPQSVPVQRNHQAPLWLIQSNGVNGQQGGAVSDHAALARSLLFPPGAPTQWVNDRKVYYFWISRLLCKYLILIHLFIHKILRPWSKSSIRFCVLQVFDKYSGSFAFAVVLSSLLQLSTATSILNNPSMLPEEATQAVTRRDAWALLSGDDRPTQTYRKCTF